MKVERGDVLLLDYPSIDSGGSVVRPVVVVQSDERNAVLPTTIVVTITNNLSRVGTDPTQLFIDVNTPDSAGTGLSANSAVMCRNLFTIDQDSVHRKLGKLSDALMQQVTSRLKMALQLS
jgi:mRNA-degrading endonuclease toxin of MazEF toxin-antitoxin module